MTSTEPTDTPATCIAALYKFAAIADCVQEKQALDALCEPLGVKGTLLLAPEGINGTIAGSEAAIDAVVRHIRALPGFADTEVKTSWAQTPPFQRLRVRIKREIVTMGQPSIDPLREVGDYVAAEDWNALISDPDTIVIDTRNSYEVAIGSFAGAINPRTRTFREFPDWFRANREALLSNDPNRRVAMFCTGGIRCEKATAFLKSEGVDQVYHLKGGILRYLEDTPAAESLWEGECFVFDERTTVTHDLQPGSSRLCPTCNSPILAGNPEHTCPTEGPALYEFQK
jgi:UPF0176 protein